MKFVFADRDRAVDYSFKEFDNLEEFVKWAVESQLPRCVFVAPNSTSYWSSRIVNNSDDWMIYTESDYD